MQQYADDVRAFRPRLEGVAEVLHARWRRHSYPAHTHSTWTVLIVDEGAIGYDLDTRHAQAPPRSGVTVLPPHVAHDGHGLTRRGFTKRVIYLDEAMLDRHLIGRAVDSPFLDDAELRDLVSILDRDLVAGDSLSGEAALALVRERLTWHLSGRPAPPSAAPARPVARRAREILDAEPTGHPTLAAVADDLGVTVPHLIRSFTETFGISPHRYLIGRRLDHARGQLLAQVPVGDVAIASGFYDQSHLTRQFKRFLGTTPARFQRSGG